MDKINHALSGVEDNAARLLKMEGKNVAVLKRQAELEAKVNEADEKADSAIESAANANAEVTALKTRMSTAEEQIDTLSGSVSSAESSISTLRTIVNSMRSVQSTQARTLSTLSARDTVIVLTPYQLSNGMATFGIVHGAAGLLFFTGGMLSVSVSDKWTTYSSGPVLLTLPDSDCQVIVSDYRASIKLVVFGNDVYCKIY